MTGKPCTLSDIINELVEFRRKVQQNPKSKTSGATRKKWRDLLGEIVNRFLRAAQAGTGEEQELQKLYKEKVRPLVVDSLKKIGWEQRVEKKLCEERVWKIREEDGKTSSESMDETGSEKNATNGGTIPKQLDGAKLERQVEEQARLVQGLLRDKEEYQKHAQELKRQLERQEAALMDTQRAMAAAQEQAQRTMAAFQEQVRMTQTREAVKEGLGLPDPQGNRVVSTSAPPRAHGH